MLIFWGAAESCTMRFFWSSSRAQAPRCPFFFSFHSESRSLLRYLVYVYIPVQVSIQITPRIFVIPRIGGGNFKFSLLFRMYSRPVIDPPINLWDLWVNHRPDVLVSSSNWTWRHSKTVSSHHRDSERDVSHVVNLEFNLSQQLEHFLIQEKIELFYFLSKYPTFEENDHFFLDTESL